MINLTGKLPAISALLVAVLLCVVPFAGTFPPDPVLASQRHTQTILVAFSLIICMLSVGALSIGFASKQPLDRIATLAAGMLACFSIGWRCIPYWVTGVYTRDLGIFPYADMDPKRLIPMIWIGEFWRMGVLLAALLTIIGVPILVGLAIRSALRHRWLDALLTCLNSVLALGFLFWLQRDYAGWILD